MARRHVASPFLYNADIPIHIRDASAKPILKLPKKHAAIGDRYQLPLWGPQIQHPGDLDMSISMVLENQAARRLRHIPYTRIRLLVPGSVATPP